MCGSMVCDSLSTRGVTLSYLFPYTDRFRTHEKYADCVLNAYFQREFGAVRAVAADQVS